MSLNPIAALLLISSFLPVAAHAEDSVGKIEFYKGGEYSSMSHYMVTGPAALSMFNHLREVPETRDDVQGIVVRRNANMDCTYYYKDTLRERLCKEVLPPNHTPEDLANCLKAAQFYRCEFRMDESGRVHGGYAQ